MKGTCLASSTVESVTSVMPSGYRQRFSVSSRVKARRHLRPVVGRAWSPICITLGANSVTRRFLLSARQKSSLLCLYALFYDVLIEEKISSDNSPPHRTILVRKFGIALPCKLYENYLEYQVSDRKCSGIRILLVIWYGRFPSSSHRVRGCSSLLSGPPALAGKRSSSAPKSDHFVANNFSGMYKI